MILIHLAYGVQASATDFEATPLGPNPPPGDPTLSTLSQDRSSRSGSKGPVDRPSSKRSDRSAMKGSTGNQSHRSPGTGNTSHRSHQSLVTPGAQVRPVKLGAPTTPGQPGAPVTPCQQGALVTPVNTCQKALVAQDTQLLEWSELIVLNSPVRPVQLEHNGCVSLVTKRRTPLPCLRLLGTGAFLYRLTPA